LSAVLLFFSTIIFTFVLLPILSRVQYCNHTSHPCTPLTPNPAFNTEPILCSSSPEPCIQYYANTLPSDPAFSTVPLFHQTLHSVLCPFSTEPCIQYFTPLLLNSAFNTVPILRPSSTKPCIQYFAPLPPNSAFSTTPILCPSSTKPFITSSLFHQTRIQYCNNTLPLDPAFSTVLLFHQTRHSVLNQYYTPLTPNPAFSTVPILHPSTNRTDSTVLLFHQTLH
jgi:hypothetical protein